MVSRRKSHPYVDRGKPGELRVIGGVAPFVGEPPKVPVRILSVRQLRRHNVLSPWLLQTDRILLRWGESLGSGIPNHDAEIREIHYDPLPPDMQEDVDAILALSPWQTLAKYWYRTNLDRRKIAEYMKISRTQLYTDWQSSLWYHRGRFEAAGIHG